MKITRKGFTLVELLIVVAILATLTATMTYSISGSTAKAKASAIASNVEALKGAVALYVVNNASDGLKTMKTDDVLRATMPKWADFSDSGATTGVKYTPDATAVSPENWVVTVDFYAEPERDDIRTELQKIKGYNKYYKASTTSGEEDDITKATVESVFATTTGANDYKFKVFLISGRIEPGA